MLPKHTDSLNAAAAPLGGGVEPPPRRTMATPVMVPLIKTYREYFASTETNPFTDKFAAIMAPYAIYPTNAGDAVEPTALYMQV